jgi:hypothetical protein
MLGSSSVTLLSTLSNDRFPADVMLKNLFVRMYRIHAVLPKALM